MQETGWEYAIVHSHDPAQLLAKRLGGLVTNTVFHTMDITGPVVLISDLHLTAEDPSGLECFEAFTRHLHGVDQLYILGDLFEYWVGDDSAEALGLTGVCTALKRLHESGTQITLMTGNRDFLLGQDFCKSTGCHLLQEPAEEEISGHLILLQHGDKLCTDDINHQQHRAIVDQPSWRETFLNKSFSQRQSLAQAGRSQSEAGKRYKSADIMDVNHAAVENALLNSRCSLLIHGHTHRPGIHVITFENRTAWRIVLGDWTAGPSYVCVAPERLDLYFEGQVLSLSQSEEDHTLRLHPDA